MTRKIIKWWMCALFCLLPAAGAWAAGAVYAMTNALGNNQILFYHRANDGTLTGPIQTISTGGGGSGLQLSSVDSLGSQGSLKLDDSHHLLFAVNTDSAMENNGMGGYNQDCNEGTISSYLVGPDGFLTFADRVMSGGLYPNSVTVTTINREEVLYVLNAGGPGFKSGSNTSLCGMQPNITGFKVNHLGLMTPIVNSTRSIDPGSLNGTGSGVDCPSTGGFAGATFDCGLNPPAFPRSAAEVRFSPNNAHLLVTVKGTNSIYVFPVGSTGLTGRAPMIFTAPGPALPTFFGFTFDKRNHLIVTETFGKAMVIPAGGTGAVSSFTITKTGALQQISADIGDGGTATCWVAVEPETGKYAFVSNNLSNPGTLSSYSVAENGSLTLLNAAAAAINGPNDLAIVREPGIATYLYALDAIDGTVGAFHVNLKDGSLTPVTPTVDGLPANHGAQGLAAY